MLRRSGLAPLLAATFAALILAAPGVAHPGRFAAEGFGGGLPHPLHHADPWLGLLAVATLAGALAWGVARRRHSALPVVQAAGAAVAAAGAWLLVV